MALLSYLFYLFVDRIREFLTHWYLGGLKAIAHFTFGLLEGLDRNLALKVSLRHFGEPLYQDRSVIGWFLGIIFRSFRIVIALILYGIILGIALACYLAWAGLPLGIIYWGFFMK